MQAICISISIRKNLAAEKSADSLIRLSATLQMQMALERLFCPLNLTARKSQMEPLTPKLRAKPS